MRQKDKEAAVLKANHKHQILLNMELERIEKCKRTYLHFHDFEEALMKARRNKIIQKQSELKRMKTDILKNGVDYEINRRLHVQKVQDKKRFAEMEVSRTGLTKVKRFIANEFKGAKPALRVRLTQSTGSLETKDQTGRSCFITCRSEYVTERATITDEPFMTQVVSNPSHSESCQTSFKKKTSTEQCWVKLPDLSPPAISTQLQINPVHPLNSKDVSVTQAANLWKVHRSSKKSTRNIVEEMSPFDRFRLKLQESKVRSCKHKFPSRSISAIDVLRKGEKTCEASATCRRVRSADRQ